MRETKLTVKPTTQFRNCLLYTSCFEGTRTFTTQGIDKAVFNMFKIYGSLGNEKLSFESDGTKTVSYTHLDVYKRQG